MQNTSKTSKRPISEQTWIHILMLISLITMGVHLYLTTQHYQLKLGLAESPAVCNVNATFNCDTVGVSRYATLFGIPMALLGLFTQIVFFIWLVSVRFHLSSSNERIKRFLFWFSLFVALVSVVMAYFSSFYLGTFCLFCIAAYVLSATQLFAAWRLQTEPLLPNLADDLSGFLKASRWVLVLALLIPVFAKVAHAVILDSYGFGKMEMIVQDSVAFWESSPAQNFKTDPSSGLSMGPENAKVTIVEFADFLCPHCKTASPTLEAFTQSHPDVRLIFKAFPLDGKCNKTLQREGDGLRCKLTAAVLCAESLSQKGWDGHHYVFEKQETLARGIDFGTFMDEFSQKVGVERANLETCMNADATQEAIKSQAQEGGNAKISGTPTVFVNGRLLPRGQSLPVLEAAYEKVK